MKLRTPQRLTAGLALLLLLALCAPIVHSATSQDDWTITTSDFRTQPGVIVDLSNKLFSFNSGGIQQTIPLENFASAHRIGAESTSASKFSLILLSGDRIFGEPVSVSDERIVWKNSLLGEIKIPLQQLKILLRAGSEPSIATVPKQDLVTLTNGDTVVGVITNCSPDSLSIQTEAGATSIPLASVSRVNFAAIASNQSVDKQHHFQITLTDRSRLSVINASITTNHLAISLDKERSVELQLNDLIGIEQINGPISWLAMQQPLENVQIPFIGSATPWPARFDISDQNTKLDHCIAVHSYSRLVYPLAAGWTSFRTQYAVDSTRQVPRRLADLTVRIKLDGKTVHEQTHVRSGELSNVVSLNLNGAKQLTLEADYGDGGDIQDQLLWLQPALLRASATTQPSH